MNNKFNNLESAAIECPICRWKGKEFLPFGVIPRKNAKCPNCGSLERHRLAYLYFKKIIPPDKNFKMLHFAPERCLRDFFKSYKNIDYLSADLNPGLAMKEEDMMSLSFKDNFFDIIFCSHVLEHVIDDAKAMKELFRVLKPGGFALIQVPVDRNRDKTYEDFSIISPEGRLKAFNQSDHVRIYGKDYKNKLEAAGFKVKIVRFINQKLAKKFSLSLTEELCVCSKPQKKVSVIIPCYNDGKYLMEAVESVERCDKGSYEIIIVDDGSTDINTINVIDIIGKRGHKIFRIKHSGQSSARNFGARQAQYDYLLFLDADNRIYPEYLREGVRILDENPEIGVVYGDRKTFGISNNIIVQPFDISEVVFGNTIDTCAVVRKKACEDCGGFDESLFLWEDWDFFINIFSKGWKFYRIPNVMFEYRIKSISVNSNSEIKENRIKAIEYIYKKHYPIFINGLSDVGGGGMIREKNNAIITLKEKESLLGSEICELKERASALEENLMREGAKNKFEINCLSEELRHIKRSLSWKFSQKIEKIILFLIRSPALIKIYRKAILIGQDFFERKEQSKKFTKEIRPYNVILPKKAFKNLVFGKNEKPEVSIIIPAYNNWEYTYNCLISLLENEKKLSYEVILADDNSTDETKNIKKRVENIKISRNKENLGFVKNCNRAADMASGKYLLFLNNDTYTLEDSILYLLDTIKRADDIGAVGGKIIFPDGTLQEAGSMILQDGTSRGYGRGDNSSKPEYNFLREVDYCSGAFLLVKKDLFFRFGKFDEEYSLGYYEEVDFCFKLQKRGYKVIYQPLAKIIHYETVTIKKEKALWLQCKNADVFRKKWSDKLKNQRSSGKDLNNRFSLFSRKKRNILYIDDQLPNPKLGSGYPRTYAILNQLLALDFNITFYPIQQLVGEDEILNYFQQKGVEMIFGEKMEFDSFLSQRRDYYDVVLVSRPHNLEKTCSLIKKYSGKSFLIYDAEAIFSLRDFAQLKISGKKMSEKEKEEKIRKEIGLCKYVDRAIVVCENEKKIFEKYGVKFSVVVSHQSPLRPTPKKFEERAGLLFVGGILFGGPNNPNLDAIFYFINEIFPLLREKINCDLYIAGLDKSGALGKLKVRGVNYLGLVEDLTEYYNNSKIFIVPTRFSAGLPLKAIEAASFGIPMVVSEITSHQLGWKDGLECLVGETPQKFAEKIVRLYTDAVLWNEIRRNCMERIKTEYGPEFFSESVRRAFDING